MLIKDIMKMTGLSKKAIQYYEYENFIQPLKLENGYRDYDEACVHTLLYIRKLRLLGLNMDKIRKILLEEKYAPQIYEERIHEINEETNILQKQKDILKELMEHKEVSTDTLRALEKGSPYFYTRHTGILGCILFFLSFFAMLSFYPFIPIQKDIWLYSYSILIIILIVKQALFTKGIWETVNQEISLRKISIFLIIVLLENACLIACIKSTAMISNLAINQIGISITLLAIFLYMVWDSYHMLRFEGYEKDKENNWFHMLFIHFRMRKRR